MQKPLLAMALAALLLSSMSFADDQKIGIDKTVITPYICILGGLELAAPADVNGKMNATLKPNYTIGVGFSGYTPIKGFDLNFFNIIYGGYFDIGKTDTRLVDRWDAAEDITKEISSKSLYIGLSTPVGNVKVGSLSTNSLGLSPDFWSTKGAAGLALYRRTFFPLSNAWAYESPDLKGFSFHLITGNAKRVAGVYSQMAGFPVYPITEKISLFGGTAQYQKDGYFIKATHLIRENGLQKPTKNAQGEAGSPEKSDADLSRIEAGYNKDNLFVSLGYQNLYNNAGWGDTLYMMPKKQQDALTGEPDRPTFGMKDFAFDMHEVVASVSYTAGKFTPKASIVYGQGSDDLHNNTPTFKLPGYLQYVVGIDYMLSDSIFINLAGGQIKWQHAKGTPQEDKWFDQSTIGLGITYWL